MSFERRVAFWFRRQAQEVSVHRWDAQGAAGAPEPLEAALAADGVDEWLELLAVRGGAATDGAEHTVHLHCTDVEGEWLVRQSPDGLDIERAHAKGDVAARGTASDLDLYLWGRLDADRLELFGDPALLESLRDAGRRR
jgi:predicted lipid carrier protein YhbT